MAKKANPTRRAKRAKAEPEPASASPDEDAGGETETPEGEAPKVTPENILKALESMKDAARQVTLSNGIVLRIKTVPPGLVRRAVRRIPMPEVPLVDLGNREEENPDDPDYQKAIAKCHTDRIQATFELWKALGTEVLTVPSGVWGPDDDGWVEELESVRDEGGVPLIEVQREPPATRYLEWLSLYAMADVGDATLVTAAQFARTGIIEPEVSEAIEFFRTPPARREPDDGAPGAVGGDGNLDGDADSGDGE